MLSVPGTGLTVNDLAAINLVRGIATDDTDPPNLYTVYGGDQAPGGNDGYNAPAGATTTLTPGAGFFWYFFGEAPDPLDEQVLGLVQALPVAVTGSPTSVLIADQTVQFPQRATNDGFYLAGNPFDSDFDLGGVSVASDPSGTALAVSDAVQVWDPSANSGAGGYTPYSLSGMGNPGVVTPWQGFWIEVVEDATSTPSTTVGVDVTYEFASANASGGTFVGRQAAYHDLKLKLRGTATDGRALTNEVSLFFHEEASEGWDRFDGSSPGSFGTPFVLAGLLGDRGAEAEVWQYQDSRPLEDGIYTFDLAYTGFGVGTSYEFAWPSLDGVPETWSLMLRDTMTGTEVDLREQGSYAFETMEGEPAARFEVIVGASAVSSEEAVPAVFAVGELYPNPTASQATLAVQVAESQEASVTVYDVLGRAVVSGAVALRGGSEERLDVDVSGLPAGTYVVRVAGESFAETRRLTVVR
ncbi:MAG: T9SS type A sorting domain-containing protein [Bacteroidota bacterium]